MLLQYMFACLMSELQGNYFQLVTISFGLAMASNSLAMILGAALNDVKEVTSFAPLVFVPQLLFSGFFTRLTQIPVFLRWAQYACGLSYAAKLAFMVEFDPQSAMCQASAEAADNCRSILAQADTDQFWVSILCLFAIFSVGRVVAGCILTIRAQSYY